MIRIKLCSPARNRLVIFDSEGANILEETVLYGFKPEILETRRRGLNLGLSVLSLTLKNLYLINLKELIVFHNLAGQLYKIYLFSCIEHIKPEVVITFIDNSSLFHWISKHYKKCKFYAVQNGMRNEHSLTSHLPKPPHSASEIYIPEFFCFGENEVRLYKKYDHYVGVFHPVGSIRGSYYRERFANFEPEMRFDICLVSEWEDCIFNKGLYPDLKKSMQIMYEHLLTYITENDVRFCIALRSDDQLERAYYKDLYGHKAVIIDNNRTTMSTYRAMDQSDLSVNFYSTCGAEAMGWGKKVLFCNFTGDPCFDMKEGPWFIKDPGYKSFEKTVKGLMATDSSRYAEITQEYSRYLMDYSKGPTRLRIRDKICSDLGVTQRC